MRSLKRVIIFDSQQEISLSQGSRVDEQQGSLKRDDSGNKLMHSVLENDKEALDDGKLMIESVNQGIGNFTPELMFKNIVNNYKLAKSLYGETMIRHLSGYDPGYVRKNINIPEFSEQLKKNIAENIDRLKSRGMLDKQGTVTEDALKLSSYVMYMEELDRLILKGLGEKKERKKDPYGDKADVKEYRKERYNSVAMRDTLKTAIRRGHDIVMPEDLRVHEREKKGKVSIIYALDASGSMKGEKLGMAKKAGIALAFKAIQERNDAGLIVFGSEVKASIAPTQDFRYILEELTKIQASMETDISGTIKKAVEMFPKKRQTKHLILLTDALPTRGKDPVEETQKAASFARDSGITISVVGINLDKEGKRVSKRIAEIGEGRLYVVRDVAELDAIILEDYRSVT